MKSIVHFSLFMFILTLIYANAPIAQAKVKDTPASWTEQNVLVTTQQWAEMMGKADVTALQQALDADYLHIHGTGRVENKEQFLDAFKTGARRYAPLKLEGVTVRMFKNFAIVNGTFALTAYVGDKVLEGVNRFGLVIARTPEGSRIVSFQATALPKP